MFVDDYYAEKDVNTAHCLPISPFFFSIFCTHSKMSSLPPACLYPFIQNFISFAPRDGFFCYFCLNHAVRVIIYHHTTKRLQ